MIREWQISNANLLMDGKPVHTGGVILANGKIAEIMPPDKSLPDLLTLNLHGATLYPALINAHDTLLATWFSFKGKAPYTNWLSWDNDFKRSEIFKEKMLLDSEQLYYLGAFKNLMGGAVYVMDHIPSFVREPFAGRLPVTIPSDYGIAHSICSYALPWGGGVRAEYEKACLNSLPFVIHCAEGFDLESRESVQGLDKIGALGKNSVLVHALSLSEKDMDLIAKREAHVVWCPSANMQLYHKTAPVKELLSRGVPISIGTDASVTGSKTMIEEIQNAANIYRNIYKESLPFKTLYKMVTKNAANALCLQERGDIRRGYRGDLLMLRHGVAEDHESAWMKADPADIYLVIRDGVPVFGNAHLEPIFTAMGISFDKISIRNHPMLIQSGYKRLLDTVVEVMGFKKRLDFLPTD